jgi:hypothetical protein
MLDLDLATQIKKLHTATYGMVTPARTATPLIDDDAITAAHMLVNGKPDEARELFGSNGRLGGALLRQLQNLQYLQAHGEHIQA